MVSSFKIYSNECVMCNNQLMSEIGKLRGVFGAEVDYVNDIINVTHTDEVSVNDIRNLLYKLGLISPEVDSGVVN